jgi:WXG100 family type VII secretion target
MTGFSIDTASAVSVAAGLEGEEANIVKYIRDTVAVAEEMANTWKGDAPAAFQQAKALWDEGIAKMDVGMQNACTVLRSNISSYHSTDSDLAGLFSGFNV